MLNVLKKYIRVFFKVIRFKYFEKAFKYQFKNTSLRVFYLKYKIQKHLK